MLHSENMAALAIGFSRAKIFVLKISGVPLTVRAAAHSKKDETVCQV